MELTGTNRPTQTTPPTPTHHKTVRRGEGKTAVNAKRPLYGPHPTHQPHTRTHARVSACGGGATTQPNQRTALPTQTSRWSQRQGTRPAPIPNPEAKPDSADGTAPARVRESRTPPSTHFTNRLGTASQRFRAGCLSRANRPDGQWALFSWRGILAGELPTLRS